MPKKHFHTRLRLFARAALLARAGIVTVAVLTASCQKNSTAPTLPPPSALNGLIVTPAFNRLARPGAHAIPSANVVIVDGPDAGKSATTDSSGIYHIPGLQQATFDISVTADGYVSTTTPVTLTSVGLVMTPLDFSQLRVTVVDATQRIVPETTVIVLDGPQAGVSAVADDNGAALFRGAFGDSVRIHAEKPGYNTFEASLPIIDEHPNGVVWTLVDLTAADLIQFVPGAYTLTLAAGSSCGNLPAAVQTRVYTGHIAPLTGNSAGTGYSFTMDTPVKGISWALNVAGNAAYIGNWYYDDFADPIGALIEFFARGTVAQPGAAVASLPLTYVIRYQSLYCSGSDGVLTLARQ